MLRQYGYMIDFPILSQEVTREALKNHLEPFKEHEGCGGDVIQSPFISEIETEKAMVDAVICEKCGVRAMKCALYKGNDACSDESHII